MNRDKTTLYFIKNMDNAVQDSIKDLLGIPEIKQHEKYLGLPSFAVGIKKQVWPKSKTRFGLSFKGGKRNSYPKLVGKFF